MVDNIDIVIVNWNAGEMLFNCVNSVLSSEFQNFSILIMDNGSTDKSCSNLPLNDKIRIHYLNKNFGFGNACNQALKHCKGDYILLLNPDAVINENTLQQAMEFMHHNDFAVYGTAQIGDDATLMKTCGRYPNFFTFCNDVLGLYQLNKNFFKNGFIQYDWNHDTSKQVQHVMGSFYLVRKKVIDEIGFMDDRFFVYMEDLDLSLRITKAGYKIFYDKDNIIYHKGGGVSQQIKSTRLFYALHAKYCFVKKHFSALAFISSAFVLIFLSPLSRLVFSVVIKRSKKELFQTIGGYYKFYQYLLTSKI
jgi:GT2 family glycosyltransferase